MAVRPWAYGIARHVALMARRSTGRRAQHEAPAAGELPEMPVASSAGAVLDRVDLERLLDRLPDDGREALWLHHVSGLSFREVAAVQGVSETAAKVRAHRALHRLRGEVAEEER
jgi:RNA polymerase sigma-70 factor (ECF subfamily)